MRSYMNPATQQWVFMDYNADYDRWFPHAPMMSAWADGQIRVYRPADDPTKLITMPGHKTWPTMSPSEYCHISTTDVPVAWASTETIQTSINETDIDGYDSWVHMFQHMSDVLPDIPTVSPLSLLAGILLSTGPAGPDGPLLLTILEHQQPPQQPPQHHPLPAIQPSTPSPKKPSVACLPPHVVSLLIRDAVSTGTMCPITMEPLTTENAEVTSCGHVFEREALDNWIATGHDTCPQCRHKM